MRAFRGLLAAHMNAIPFQSIDVLIGRPIRLDLEALQKKIVTDRRGGYCFKQGTLFLAPCARSDSTGRLEPLESFSSSSPTPRAATSILLSGCPGEISSQIPASGA